jgi:transcriptional regulator with XRE-family HTH domain
MKLKSEKVNNIRTNKGLSQENMANEMGISQTQYGRIENGKCSVSLDRVIEISKILDLPLNDIIEASENFIFNNCNQSEKIDTINNNQNFEQERQAYLTQIKYLEEQNTDFFKLIQSFQQTKNC